MYAPALGRFAAAVFLLVLVQGAYITRPENGDPGLGISTDSSSRDYRAADSETNYAEKDSYESYEEGYQSDASQCTINKCCKKKIKELVAKRFVGTPLVSGLLSFGLLSGFADISLICSTYYTVTATTTNTVTNIMTETLTATTTITATNTVPITNTLTATAMATITTDTTLTAPPVTFTSLIPVTDIQTNTVTTLLPRTDCNNPGGGKKRRALFSKFVEEQNDGKVTGVESLEPGPAPAAEPVLQTIEPSFTATISSETLTVSGSASSLI